MKLRSYFYGGFTTTINIILNALTFGKYLWLEGRVKRGTFRNWARRFSFTPTKFIQPTTEKEIVGLVKTSKNLRIFGSAHSFNSGVMTSGTLVSLDKYCGVIWKNLDKKHIAVKGGTRVRDIVKILLKDNLAFSALPSHDAQSIAGILSTDVHGTGRDWGFVSESVIGLKIIDGKGEVHECSPSDDLFKAAIGGIGAVGVISEVTLKVVKRFNVRQKFEISTIEKVKDNFEKLLTENEHLSLYLFPFTNKCQISTWNRTDKKKTFLGPIREFISISMDALLSAWIGNLMAYTELFPKLSDFSHRIKKGTDLVLESNKAFNRTIYHLHQELEFTVSHEETFKMCKRFLALYEEMYSKDLPYTLLEVRFTPEGHDLTLIGAGRERRSTWIDLICNDSSGFEDYYSAAEDLIKTLDTRLHLGKYCEKHDKNDMMRAHKNNFTNFLQLRNKYDPERKFANKLTQRIFGN